MDEIMNADEKEKQLAARLAGFTDGAALGSGGDAELFAAAGAVLAIRAALDDAPSVRPEFSETLRKRLARETHRLAATKKPSYRRLKWMQYAVAASFFFLFLPTMWAVWESQHRYKMIQVEKYDKMYVPFSAQLDKKNYLARRTVPFSDRHAGKRAIMTGDNRLKRMDLSFRNYSRGRRALK